MKNRQTIFTTILLALGCVALAATAHAAGPDTDGAIDGNNNGEGIGVLVSRTTGTLNTGSGFEALNHLTIGRLNTAMGVRALFSDANGGFNTATGAASLFSNTSGSFNTATGAYSLANNTTGNYNTAHGLGALFSNTADFNTATGFSALFYNTTGRFNTANGYQALFLNTTGERNTATGSDTLSNNTGNSNTANGSAALNWNTTGENNTAVGIQALLTNTTGMRNTAIGGAALSFNSTGSGNIALGESAGLYITGNNNIDIGNWGLTEESHTIRIGDSQTKTFIAGIRGRTTGNNNAIPVLIDSVGQLGTMSSSRRFKKEIKLMDRASEAILALKPVTFHYKSDASGTPQFGLIAEEVAQVNPDLVVRDENGEIYTVRYDAVSAMLLNEFLKDHRKVEEQEATITELKSTVANQETAIARQRKDFETTITELKKELRATIEYINEQDTKIERTNEQIGLNNAQSLTALND